MVTEAKKGRSEIIWYGLAGTIDPLLRRTAQK